MSVRTTYICDKCKTEWDCSDKTKQPVSIGLAISFGTTKLPYEKTCDNEVMWCRSCAMKVGICKPATAEDKIITPKVSLTTEEKIIILLEELGFRLNE
ncbi:MAG: hypothetical protein KAS32_01240 [Candidatus Peribacteraceae bacterium]|nr:hypothetical protein [Candidatus Peribacteraceae bacterium]